MSRLRPALIGRVRTSTIILIALFVGTALLYLFVRPAGSSQIYVRVPAGDVATAHPTTTTHPTTTVP